MALETPNVAHAAGTALATLNSDPQTIALVAGQGFERVDYGEFSGELTSLVQVWTLNRQLAGAEAIIMAGQQGGVSGVQQMAPVPQFLVDIGFPVLEPNQLVTFMDLEDSGLERLALWCVVYAVPPNGSPQ